MHVDGNGYGTIVEILTGEKVWYVFEPDLKNHPECWEDELVDPRDVPMDAWKVHAVRLRAGDHM